MINRLMKIIVIKFASICISCTSVVKVLITKPPFIISWHRGAYYAMHTAKGILMCVTMTAASKFEVVTYVRSHTAACQLLSGRSQPDFFGGRRAGGK